MFKKISDEVSVAGQMTQDDLAAIVAAGFKSIIVNRPDGEIPPNLHYSEMEQAAKAAGLEICHVPMAGGISPELIEQSNAAHGEMPKPILAYCGSGTRSAALWCFANVQDLGVDGVLSSVAAAGYQLEQLRPILSK